MLLKSASDTNPTRREIQKYIETHPGAHFSKLVRELEFASGQVQYHLRRLLSNEQIVEVRLYGRTHYYPPGFDEWERNALALFRRETAREVLLYLLEHERATPAEVTEALGIARSTLEWHLNHLIEQELVQKRRGQQNTVILTVADPERTIKLLTTVVPSVSDRLVDRFLRFIDHLFDGRDAA